MDISDVTSEIMEQVQVYASAYSLMGGRFDHGDKRELADEERAVLRSMVLSALENANDDCRRANELTNAAIDDYNTVLARLKRAEELLRRSLPETFPQADADEIRDFLRGTKDAVR